MQHLDYIIKGASSMHNVSRDLYDHSWLDKRGYPGLRECYYFGVEVASCYVRDVGHGTGLTPNSTDLQVRTH